MWRVTWEPSKWEIGEVNHHVDKNYAMLPRPISGCSATSYKSNTISTFLINGILGVVMLLSMPKDILRDTSLNEALKSIIFLPNNKLLFCLLLTF